MAASRFLLVPFLLLTLLFLPTTSQHHHATPRHRSSTTPHQGQSSLLPPCNLTTVYNGRWHRIPALRQVHPDHWGFGMYNQRDCNVTYMTKWGCWDDERTLPRVRKVVQWEWIPNDCTLQHTQPDGAFANDVVRMYNGRRLLYLGDSKARQPAYSSSCLLMNPNATASSREREEVEWTNVNVTDDFAIRFFLSPYLLRTTIAHDNVTGRRLVTVDPDALDTATTDELLSFRPDVVVVAIGARWAGFGMRQIGQSTYGLESDAFHSLYKRAITRLIDFVRRHLPNAVIVLRTTEARHYANGDWDTQGTCTLEDPIVSESGDVPKAYRRAVMEGMGNHETLVQRSIMAAIVADYNTPHVCQSDQFELFLARADGHPFDLNRLSKAYDCSHYCQRGVGEYATVAFLQALYTQLVASQLWNPSE